MRTTRGEPRDERLWDVLCGAVWFRVPPKKDFLRVPPVENPKASDYGLGSERRNCIKEESSGAFGGAKSRNNEINTSKQVPSGSRHTEHAKKKKNKGKEPVSLQQEDLQNLHHLHTSPAGGRGRLFIRTSLCY